MRPAASTGSAWQAHPKLVTLPLGLFRPWRQRQNRAGGFPKSFHEGYFASILALTKGGTAGGRKHLLSLGKSPHREVIQQQLSALHPSTLHIARGSKNQSEYFRTLLDSTFVVSPPGVGADCYRHWEALAFGAIPVVARTGVALSTLRSAPVVVVADYAFAHARRLRGYHSRLLDDPITSRVSMAILTQRFWLEKIIDVALNRSRIRTSLSEEVDGPINASHARVSKATVGRGEMADCPCQCKWLRPALTGCAAMPSWGLSQATTRWNRCRDGGRKRECD